MAAYIYIYNQKGTEESNPTETNVTDVFFILNLISHVFIISSFACSRFNIKQLKFVSILKVYHYISGEKRKHAQFYSILQ